jgi:hypothetical protein
LPITLRRRFMKKAVMFVAVLSLLVGGFACKGGGKYADAISVIEKFVASNEGLLKSLEGAKDAESVAAALNKATADVKELAPKMKALGEKYPEFKNMENPPAELKPAVDKLMAVAGKMMGVFEKIGPFLSDPKVQEAQKAYSEAQAGMQ